MKRYFKNLLSALFGNNPYRLALDKATEKCEQTANSLRQLEVTEADHMKRIAGYQNLIENLRKRVTEKDITLDNKTKEHFAEIDKIKAECRTEIEKMRELCDRRLDERDGKIAALREDLDDTLERLQQANRALAHDLMAQQMLDKTMNALDDLYATMQSGDAEQIRAFTEKLEWCNPLLRIAQKHIMVLQRKAELEERLRLANSQHDDNFNME